MREKVDCLSAVALHIRPVAAFRAVSFPSKFNLCPPSFRVDSTMSATPTDYERDPEKGSYEKGGYAEAVPAHRAEEVAPDEVLVNRWGFMGKIMAKMFDVGVEARGVERVPEDQRETKNTWNNLLMWW